MNTGINGVHLLEPTIHKDERGEFCKIFSIAQTIEVDLDFKIKDINNSLSFKRGTIRGLHYQSGEYGEVKVVRCVQGSIFDVVVDVRPDSPTFGQWEGFTIDASNKQVVVVPEGVAHGFQTLVDNAEVIYASSADYVPEAEMGLRWDDPHFSIDWPLNKPDEILLSDKDRSWPLFKHTPSVSKPSNTNPS